MAARKDMVSVPGSQRAPLPAGRVVGKLDPNERIRVTVMVRPQSPDGRASAITALAKQRPQERTYITREQLASRYGASSDDLTRVEGFAMENGLDVLEESSAKRSIGLSGTVAQFSRAFGVQLTRFVHPSGVFRARSGSVYVPADLTMVVQAVLGLDNRPQARAHFRLPTKAAQSGTSFTPPQVAQFYGFPKGLDGTGQSVAIIELGGGYRTLDLRAYFSSLGIPLPKVLSISVDGAGNAPTGDPSGPDAEVTLDVEIIGAIAPAANIYVYFAPNTDAGFVDAVSAAVHDTQHKPSVLSVSWGGPEASWTKQGSQALDQAFQEAALVGVSVTAASGDSGSSDGLTDGLAHVDFPASSPYVLGCGGTRTTVLKTKGTISSEAVWNDLPSGGASGGGVSDLFPLPTWQSRSGVPSSVNPGGPKGRGVPDVSGDADPATGYTVQTDGKRFPIGGTSAVAPLWASLLTLVNQSAAGTGRKPAGYVNPSLYQYVTSASGAFRDIKMGNNGSYDAAPGWDACTGLGSPDGAKLLQQLLVNMPSKRSW